MLVGRRPEGFRQHRETVNAQCELPAARGERRAIDSEQVAEIKAQQPLEGLVAQHVALGLQLDPAGPVDEVEKGHLALPAPGRQAPGDPVRGVGLLAVCQPFVSRADGRHRLHRFERRREGIDSARAQLLELATPAG